MEKIGIDNAGFGENSPIVILVVVLDLRNQSDFIVVFFKDQFSLQVEKLNSVIVIETVPVKTKCLVYCREQ
jgi:hypothetical protein